MTLRPTWQEEKPDEDDAFEVMDSSGLQGLGLPTHFGAQKSSKVSSTLPYQRMRQGLDHGWPPHAQGPAGSLKLQRHPLRYQDRCNP